VVSFRANPELGGRFVLFVRGPEEFGEMFNLKPLPPALLEETIVTSLTIRDSEVYHSDMDRACGTDPNLSFNPSIGFVRTTS